MTVESSTTSVELEGNGSAREFSFSPIKIFDATQLEVVLRDTDGSLTTLTRGTGSAAYSVQATFTENEASTGSVRYPDSGGTLLTAGQFLSIRRVVPFKQETNFENQGGYLPEVQEATHDLHTMRALQLQEELNRTVKVPFGSDIEAADYLAEAAASAATASAAATTATTKAGEAASSATAAAASALEAASYVGAPAAGTVGLTELEDGTADRLLGYGSDGSPVEVSVSGATLSGGTLTISSSVLFGPYRSGGVYVGFGNDYNFTGAAMTANRLYYHPFFVRSTHTFDRISIYVKSTSGGTGARLGIYNMEGGIPTTLVLDCGTVSTATSGAKEIVISQSLAAGQYALCAVFDGSPTIVTIAPDDGTFMDEQLGTKSDIADGFGYGGYKNHTYGALPSPFGSVTAEDETTVPLLGLRAA